MTDIYEQWENTCNQIVLNNIVEWKKLQGVNYMLEHLSYEHARVYLEHLLKDGLTPDLIQNLCELNDKHGGTSIYNFSHGITASTSSIRYIRHAFDVCNLIKKKNIESSVRVVEVGGGYGGLCLILCELSKLLNVSIREYCIYDIPYVQSLQKYYLKNFKEVFDIVKWKDCSSFGEDLTVELPNILVSNYCMSEIPNEYRKQYLANMLPKVQGAYFAWNWGSKEDLPVNREEEPEFPETGPRNTIIRL